MNEYKYQQRRKKRGEHCLIGDWVDPLTGEYHYRKDGLCGCGKRTPPSKKYKTRIIRRSLKRLLNEE